MTPVAAGLVTYPLALAANQRQPDIPGSAWFPGRIKPCQRLGAGPPAYHRTNHPPLMMLHYPKGRSLGVMTEYPSAVRCGYRGRYSLESRVLRRGGAPDEMACGAR